MYFCKWKANTYNIQKTNKQTTARMWLTPVYEAVRRKLEENCLFKQPDSQKTTLLAFMAVLGFATVELHLQHIGVSKILCGHVAMATFWSEGSHVYSLHQEYQTPCSIRGQLFCVFSTCCVFRFPASSWTRSTMAFLTNCH